MPPVLFSTLLYGLPAIVFIIMFFLIFDVSFRYKKTSSTKPVNPEPNIEELEQKLDNLLKNNRLATKTEELQQDLQQTPTHTITAYMQMSKKDLKGFHLFQLIFSLIKNGAEDNKIIKILHHYLPSASRAHLYALLKSCKEFLNISAKDGKQKELIKDLNQNNLKSTLLYLQSKLNYTLNQVATMPPALQQPLIDTAVQYGLIFAGFAEFYNTAATEKILRLCNMLSPELFIYWHKVPKQNDNFSNKKNTLPSHTPLQRFH